MPSNPDKCGCNSQLFSIVWSVDLQESEAGVLDPKEGNTIKRPVGFRCVECGDVQLTREVPQDHADDTTLEYPDSADRDMVREP